MSSQALATPYWSKQLKKTPRSVVLVLALTVIATLLYFKSKPLFADNPPVKAFVREDGRAKQPDSTSKWDIPQMLAGLGAHATGKVQRATGGASTTSSLSARASVPRVLERPIFDGKNVTLQVRLTTELDSASGDTSVEGRIIGVMDQDQTGSVDTTTVKNAVIRGSATPNFDAKRYMARFSEVLTTEGKAIPVAGIAFNPGDSSLGIPSEYSSGLPSRLVGSALNRVIVAADQVAETHVLDNNSDSAVSRELSRVAGQGSSETANGVGDEATRTLRETKPILKVKAGMIIFVKMQSARASGGSR